MGALNLFVSDGAGLRHMSVDGCAVSWKDADVGDGGVVLLFANLKGSWDAIALKSFAVKDKIEIYKGRIANFRKENKSL